MKLLRTLVIVLLIFSCSDKSKILEFESILGKENSEILDSLVVDFETTYLKKKYPNLSLDKAYEKYLTDIYSDSEGNWERPSNKNIEKFDDSKLKEIIYGIPDSIWIVQRLSENKYAYSIRRTYLNVNGDYEIGTSTASTSRAYDEDSLIVALKNDYDINYFGTYREALKQVSKKNKFVKKYLEITQSNGILDQRTVAYEMLVSDLDFDNYFIKCLVLTEITLRL